MSVAARKTDVPRGVSPDRWARLLAWDKAVRETVAAKKAFRARFGREPLSSSAQLEGGDALREGVERRGGPLFVCCCGVFDRGESIGCGSDQLSERVRQELDVGDAARRTYEIVLKAARKSATMRAAIRARAVGTSLRGNRLGHEDSMPVGGSGASNTRARSRRRSDGAAHRTRKGRA